MRFFFQLFALLWKNVLLFKRNKISSLCHLFMPAMCVVAFGAIVLSSGGEAGVRNPSGNSVFSRMSLSELKGTDEFAGSTLAKDAITHSLPPCRTFDGVGGRFGFGRPRPDVVDCITLLYAPNTDANVTRIMNKMALQNGLEIFSSGTLTTTASDVKEAYDIVGLPSKEALESFLKNPANRGLVGGAYLFSPDGLVVPEVNSSYIDYQENRPVVPVEIWFNRTVSGSIAANVGDDYLFYDGGRASLALQYQRALGEAMIAVHTGDDDAEISFDVRMFPRVDRFDSEGFVASLGGVFYLVGIMFVFLISMRLVVEEKENHVLDAMRMFGLNEGAYWLSWWIFFLMMSIVSCSFMVGVGTGMGIPVFENVSGKAMFRVLLFYMMCMQTLAMMFASFINTTKTAITLGMLFLLLGVLLQIVWTFMNAFLDLNSLILNPYFLPQAAVALVYIFPPLLFTRIDDNFNAVTRKYTVVTSDGNTTTSVERRLSYDMDMLSEGPYMYTKLASIGSYQETAHYYNATSCFSYPQDAQLQDKGCYEYVAKCAKVKGPFGGTYTPTECPETKCTASWSRSLPTLEECEAAGGVFEKLATPEEEATDNGLVYINSVCHCHFSVPSDQSSILQFFWEIILFSVAAWYFGQICTGGHGKAARPWFCCVPAYWVPALRKTQLRRGRYGTCVDADAKEEEKQISLGARDSRQLVFDGLVKSFRGKYAVNGLSCSMEEGKLFALLGHNGAGKTTAINMAVGLLQCTAGDVRVHGMSVTDEMPKIRAEGIIGVCPQHDILWPQLTALEHMKFFGWFQSLHGEALDKQIKEQLESVRLWPERNNPSKSFSGGMKRRLSVAIATLGKPSVIFLDEPTTGMDPLNRRHVWERIRELKKTKTVVLTTHSMEEAEYLGDEIGIMSHGHLVALGNSLKLKAKFGGGYRIKIVAKDQLRLHEIKQAVSKTVPEAALVDAAGAELSYELGGEAEAKIPALLHWIEDVGTVGGGTDSQLISDFAVSFTTLEDVFIRLTRIAEENAAASGVKYATVAVKGDDKPVVAEAVTVDPKEGKPDAVEAVEILDDENDPAGKFDDTHYATNPNTFNQFRALYSRQYQLSKTRRITTCLQLLVPLAFVIGFTFAERAVDDLTSSSTARQTCDGCIANSLSTFSWQIESWGTLENALTQSLVWDPEGEYLDESLKFYNETTRKGYITPQGWMDAYADMTSKFDSNSYTLTLDDADYDYNTNPFYAYCLFGDSNSGSTCESYQAQLDGGLVLPEASWFRAGVVLDRIANMDQWNIGQGAVNVAITTEGPNAPTDATLGSRCFQGPGGELIDSTWDQIKPSSSGSPTDEGFLGPTSNDCQFYNNADIIERPIQGQNVGFGGAIDEKRCEFRVNSDGVLGYNEAVTAAKATIGGSWTSFLPYSLSQVSRGAATATPNYNSNLNVTKFDNMAAPDLVSCEQWFVFDAINTMFSDCLSSNSWTYDPLIIDPCFSAKVDAERASPTITDWEGNTVSNVNFRECLTAKITLKASPAVCKIDDFVAASANMNSLPEGLAKLHELLWENQVAMKDLADEDFGAKVFGEGEFGAARDRLSQVFPDAGIVFRKLSDSQLRFTLETYLTRKEWSGYEYAGMPFLTECGEDESLEECLKNAYRRPPLFSNGGRLSSSSDGAGEYSDSVSDNSKKKEVHEINIMLQGMIQAHLQYVASTGGAVKDSPFSDNVDLHLGSRAFPEVSNADSESDLGFNISQFFANLIAGSLMFYFPMVVFKVVYEKQHKLRALMSQMGLKMRNYWIVQYGFEIVVSLSIQLLAYFVGLALKLKVMKQSEFGIVLMLMILWSNAMVSWGFLFSTLFNSTKLSDIAAYTLVLVSFLVGLIVQVFIDNNPFANAPVWMYFTPFWVFMRGMHLAGGRSYFWIDIKPGEEMRLVYGALVLHWFGALSLAFYLDAVVPRQFGTNKKWYFPITDSFSFLKWLVLKLMGKEVSRARVHAAVTEKAEVSEEPAVTAERDLVAAGNLPNAAVEILNMRKVYPNGKVAVQDVSLHMDEGMLFGLLGPNGAGKSTLVNVMVGLYKPSGGQATVDGFDVYSQMDQIHQHMGVSPQFSIVWPSLTVSQHLHFFARLKGVPRSKERAIVLDAASGVRLRGALNRPAGKLSGGMRRRLSLAIAFIGNPDVVFLDEPTTGLDPETRRAVWELIEKQKKGRLIVLISHSMEEVEALADRIGIMAHGLLKAIGTSLELKNRFANNVFIDVTSLDPEKCDAFVKQVVPDAKLDGVFNERRQYTFPKTEGVKLSQVFEALLKRDKQVVIDFALRQTSLEDVFVNIAEESEAKYGTA